MNDHTFAISHLHAELANPPHTGILRDISLSISSGEVHGLVGESGAGKSMIARAVLGILPEAVKITEGAVLFQGRDLVGSV